MRVVIVNEAGTVLSAFSSSLAVEISEDGTTAAGPAGATVVAGELEITHREEWSYQVPEGGRLVASETAALGDVLAGGVFTPSKGSLKAYADEKRRALETAGITVSGVPIRTDDRTRSSLLEARAAADADPSWSTHWRLANGAWLKVTPPMLPGLIAATGKHRGAAFDKQHAAELAIDAGTITTFEQVDQHFAA